MRQSKPTEKVNAIFAATKDAVNLYLLARAHAEIIRKHIDAIKAEYLASNICLNQHTGERITAPKDDWHMSDEQFRKYADALAIAYKEHGYKLPDKDYCPALMAEHSQREAEWAIIAVTEPFFGITNNALLCKRDGKGLEARQRWIDLTVSMVVSHPDYVNPLNEVKKMRAIRVHYADGNTTTTNINGSIASVNAYYIGKSFCFGTDDTNEKMVKAVRVEFLD